METVLSAKTDYWEVFTHDYGGHIDTCTIVKSEKEAIDYIADDAHLDYDLSACKVSYCQVNEEDAIWFKKNGYENYFD